MGLFSSSKKQKEEPSGEEKEFDVNQGEEPESEGDQDKQEGMTLNQINNSDLSPEEKEMAKKRLNPDEGSEESGEESEEQPEEGSEQTKSTQKEEETSGQDQEGPTDQEIAQKAKEDLSEEEAAEYSKDLNKEQAGLFYAMREEREKRQKAQAENESLRLKLKTLEKEEKEQEGSKTGPQQRIQEIENEIQEFYNQDDDEVLTMNDLKRIDELKNERDKLKKQMYSQKNEKQNKQAQVLDEKLTEIHKKEQKKAEERGDDFDYYVNKAREVMEEDPFYRQSFARAAASVLEDGDERKPVEMVYKIAKLNEDFKPLSERRDKTSTKEEKSTKKDKTKEENRRKVERIMENSEKTPGSGSVKTGSNKRRKVSEKDLTPEDLKGWDPKDLRKLSKETRVRLLKEMEA